MTKDELLEKVRQADSVMTLREKVTLAALLSFPAIIAQFSYIAMQMIDAAMLGHLGTDEAAAVGLVSTTIWLYGGLCSAFAAGFSVQVAHRVGAGDEQTARNVIRQGVTSALVFAVLLMVTGLALAPVLPHWLGATDVICRNATEYFSIFACGLPIVILNGLTAGCLRCSGNIKFPSTMMVMMCALDVVFNYIFIFIMNMGTIGAAYGTMLAYAVAMVGNLWYLTMKDRKLRLANDTDTRAMEYIPQLTVLREAARIGLPISLERGVMCTAQIKISSIIAPLGTVAIAANTFAINVESLCYMPGSGIAEAATTLVGQSKGAGRHDLMRSFAWINMSLGVGIMMFMGMMMWIFAPEMMSVITPDRQVVEMGAEVLRIEAWAEPGFAAAIVANGIFVGAGRTLIPSLMNLGSIWLVRISLTLMLAPVMGLRGVWIAMAIELTFRGLIFVVRLLTTMKKDGNNKKQGIWR